MRLLNSNGIANRSPEFICLTGVLGSMLEAGGGLCKSSVFSSRQRVSGYVGGAGWDRASEVCKRLVASGRGMRVW